LMQFPLQQEAFASPDGARVRPQHCMVELDYRTPRDGSGAYGAYQMSTRSYNSHTIPVSTHMAVGKMINKPGAKGLHLVPLQRISQMRPSFAHVDEATTSASATTTDDDLMQAEADASKLERKPLTFQKKESERAVLARKSTYAFKKMSEESELWHNLNVHDKHSAEAGAVTEKVICPNTEEIVMAEMDKNKPGKTIAAQYVGTLNYLLPSHISQAKDEDVEQVSGVVAKLVRLMQEGWPIPYLVLKSQFPPFVSDGTLLQALGSCAFLVRGNFVLHSKLLPVKPSIAHARTFILFLFQTIEVVHRSRLEHVYAGDAQVNPETLIMLLEQVGRKTTGGWKLRVDDDPSFAEKHQETLLMHLNYWTSQLRRYQPLLDLYRQ
jgi:DNA-directed RNA polymerase-3 subunit RPC5